ncbi:MAG: hypothetical protein EPO40_08725 [Myxococcaceae bacterium]|nr:MAG: hypothetical protein EPO40_08725 [Myxococcaceae bacterium]
MVPASAPSDAPRVTHWILAVLALHVAQTLLAPTIRYLLAGPGVVERLRLALGPRDVQPPLSAVGARAARALANLHEALPVFLTVALLHVAQRTASPSASHGAACFLVARVLYVPAYLSGVPGLRSLLWVASWIALASMLLALRA